MTSRYGKGADSDATDALIETAPSLTGQLARSSGQDLGQDGALVPGEEVGSLQAADNGWRGDADSAAAGHFIPGTNAEVSEAIDRGELAQSLTTRFGSTGADLPDGEANFLVPGEDARPYTVQSENSNAMRGEGEAPVAAESETARSLDHTGGYAHNQGGTVVGPGESVSPALTSSPGFAAGCGHSGGDQQSLEVTHALTAEGHDASEDGTGRGTPIVGPPIPSGWGKGGGNVDGMDEAIAKAAEARAEPTAFTQNQREEVREQGEAGALQTEPGGHQQTYLAGPPETFTKKHGASSAEDDESWEESDAARTLNSMSGSDAYATEAAVDRARNLVRRLTPTECERLQGFPDGWTIPEGPSLADAPSWYERPAAPPAGGWGTYDALPDQRGRDAGHKGAVDLRETDRSLTLDTSGRDPSAFNGGMMAVREGEPVAFDDRNQEADSETHHTLRGEGGGTRSSDCVMPPDPAAFNWQSGGDVRHGLNEEGRTDALHKGQTPAVFDVARGEAKPGEEVGTLRGGKAGPERHPGRSGTEFTAVVPGAGGRDAPHDPLPDGPRYASLGDAVTVPVGQWLGERLLHVLRLRGEL